MKPLVTFVVPCFKLAHVLGECLESILSQTYTNLEVIVMDDCSPDNTPEVAASIRDPRVRHVRNEVNLGHLRNYDRGIRMARGEYLWLLSADDKLYRDYALARFVDALDANPRASLVFCPSVRIGDEGELLDVDGSVGDTDRTYRRAEFLKTVLYGNSVSAPATLARTHFYHDIGGFPLDLPFAGDWYIWARFALEGEVIYLSEPLTNYRLHSANMTKTFLGARAAALVKDEVEIAWRIRRDALARGDRPSADLALNAVATDYGRRVGQYLESASPFGLSIAAVESDLRARRTSETDTAYILGRVYGAAGDANWDLGRFEDARIGYRTALRFSPGIKRAAKYLLAAAGAPGRMARQAVVSARRHHRAGSQPPAL